MYTRGPGRVAAAVVGFDVGIGIGGVGVAGAAEIDDIAAVAVAVAVAFRTTGSAVSFPPHWPPSDFPTSQYLTEPGIITSRSLWQSPPSFLLEEKT